MEFFKNFFKEDDKIVGLCSLKRKSYRNFGTEFEPKFGATKLIYEPKIKYNFFMI